MCRYVNKQIFIFLFFTLYYAKHHEVALRTERRQNQISGRAGTKLSDWRFCQASLKLCSPVISLLSRFHPSHGSSLFRPNVGLDWLAHCALQIDVLQFVAVRYNVYAIAKIVFGLRSQSRQTLVQCQLPSFSPCLLADSKHRWFQEMFLANFPMKNGEYIQLRLP